MDAMTKTVTDAIYDAALKQLGSEKTFVAASVRRGQEPSDAYQHALDALAHAIIRAVRLRHGMPGAPDQDISATAWSVYRHQLAPRCAALADLAAVPHIRAGALRDLAEEHDIDLPSRDIQLAQDAIDYFLVGLERAGKTRAK